MLRYRRRRLLAAAAGGCQSNRRRRLRAAEPRSGGAVDNTPLAADDIWRAALAARLRKGAAELARLRPNHPEGGQRGAGSRRRWLPATVAGGCLRAAEPL